MQEDHAPARVDSSTEAQPDVVRETRDVKAPKPADEGPKMNPAFERLLSSTFAIDALKIADELDGKLRIPRADQASRGDLARILGEANENARKAHLLYVNAVSAREEFESRVEANLGDLRRRAHESLAASRDAGTMSKRKDITNADVEAEMARLAPDEYERIRVRRKRVELMVEQARREAELHRHFPQSVEALLSTSRSPSL